MPSERYTLGQSRSLSDPEVLGAVADARVCEMLGPAAGTEGDGDLKGWLLTETSTGWPARAVRRCLVYREARLAAARTRLRRVSVR